MCQMLASLSAQLKHAKDMYHVRSDILADRLMGYLAKPDPYSSSGVKKGSSLTKGRVKRSTFCPTKKEGLYNRQTDYDTRKLAASDGADFDRNQEAAVLSSLT